MTEKDFHVRYKYNFMHTRMIMLPLNNKASEWKKNWQHKKQKNKKEIELIFEMNKEGFTIPQIASVTRRSEEEIKKILDCQGGN